jgi:hypothetical protein
MNRQAVREKSMAKAIAEITNRTQEIAANPSNFMPTEMMPLAMTSAK